MGSVRLWSRLGCSQPKNLRTEPAPISTVTMSPTLCSPKRLPDPALGASPELREHVGQHRDRPVVLLDLDVLVGGVVEARVAGAVGDDRATPGRADHVHIGGAGLV